MDTDDLSIEAYEGILSEAEGLSHDLTIHYGVLSGECNDEQEYLEKAGKLTRQLLQLSEDQLWDAFWGDPPGKDELDSTLHKILENIRQIKQIPYENRNFDSYD